MYYDYCYDDHMSAEFPCDLIENIHCSLKSERKIHMFVSWCLLLFPVVRFY